MSASRKRAASGPVMPSKEDIVKNKDAWKSFAKEILNIIERDDTEIKDKELSEEIEKFENEGLAERTRRCRDSKNWVWEPSVDYDEEDSCLADNCWFERNLDRRREYKGSYRLIGTSEAYLCAVCLANGAHKKPSDDLEIEIQATLNE
jgi:hypothetical protein